MSSIFVSGANRGIGLELVRQLSRNGRFTTIIAGARSMSPELDNLLREHSAKIHFVHLDITSDESVNAAFEFAREILCGRGLSILVNNAGIKVDTMSLMTTSPDDMDKNFSVNVAGTHRVVLKFVPLMEQASGRRIIVNLSSFLGSVTMTGDSMIPSYRVSKCALNMYNKTLSLELNQHNILCVAVHPGWVRTDMGGPHGHLSPQQAVQNIIHIIEKSNTSHNGLLITASGGKISVMPF